MTEPRLPNGITRREWQDMTEGRGNYGTLWTEPGQGATGRQLLRALVEMPILHGEERLLWNRAEAAIPTRRPKIDRPTNLRLVGALTVEDLKRIATCEVARNG